MRVSTAVLESTWFSKIPESKSLSRQQRKFSWEVVGELITSSVQKRISRNGWRCTRSWQTERRTTYRTFWMLFAREKFTNSSSSEPEVHALIRRMETKGEER